MGDRCPDCPIQSTVARRGIYLAAWVRIFSLLVVAETLYPSFKLKSTLRIGQLLPLLPHENQPATLATGDFNGDGHPDLVVGSLWNNKYSNELSLFLSKGDGSFGTRSVIKLHARPQRIAVAEFNGDGISDLALTTESQITDGPSELWAFTGTQAGSLKLSWKQTLQSEQQNVFIADLDGDGKLDLALSVHARLSQIFRGHGDGTFETPRFLCRCNLLLAVDLNGDRQPDLVVSYGEDIAVRMNLGNSRFTQPAALGTQGYSPFVSGADMNADGIPDLTFADPKGGLAVYLGKGDGTFLPPLLTNSPASSVMRVADLNGDGFSDVLLLNWNPKGKGKLLIFLGKGGGTFRSPITMDTSYTPSDVAIADFNSDRKLDIAVSSLGAQAISVFLQR